MKKLWGFVNFVGLLIAAAGFITHSAVLIVLGIAVCLLGEWQKSRVSRAGADRRHPSGACRCL